MDKQIDVVIPWVDDGDSEWVKKKNQFLDSDEGYGQFAASNRYTEYGTLKYVLRSIEHNMPWVGKIFLLTDNQVPSWLNLKNTIIVDHKEFIKGKLPTFNSNVILTSIGNIKDLSENFIIFNDETIVWSPVKKENFFVNDLPVDSLIESGTVPKIDGFFHISQNDVAIINEHFNKRQVYKEHFFKFFNFKYGIQNIRNILSLPYGGFLGFQNQHLVMPYTKANFQNAYKMFNDDFEKTWTHRFRELSDVNEWLIRYARNVEGKFQPGYLKGQFFSLSDFQTSTPEIKKNTKIVVINDDGNYSASVTTTVNRFLQTRFPEKSKYEK
ncbi:Stealth CR1 domain-containing protein [Lactiplantibacillus plantarum]|uniref:Stealth CR1 domain-containing protein n=1 Tax=Lactiplantibacillus plantarum TaxID=1590 RepID=UPI001FCD0B7B|nr:Stealth CR1 domain-containing protein [Lactiplantibacillus plantarum]MCJ2385368.1 Stealth CR1 domain-containing protein [Lactiplantibacillus plantarum]